MAEPINSPAPQPPCLATREEGEKCLMFEKPADADPVRPHTEQLWVSHHKRCMAFHEESGFYPLQFPDKQALWETVFQLLEQRYVIK